MKRILIILIISVISFSCKKSEPKMDGYVINGTAAGVYDGVRVYLKSKIERGKETVQDTAIVFDERFTFEGKVDSPKLWYLSVNSVKGDLPLIIENNPYTIDIDKSNINETVINGPKTQMTMQEYMSNIELLSKKYYETNQDLRIANASQDTLKITELTSEVNLINQQLNEYPFEFLKDNSDSYFSLFLIENLLKNKKTEYLKIDNAFQSLNNDLKTNVLGTQINSQLTLLKQEDERANSLDIGKVAPDFSAPKADGQILALKDIKGKVTIVDFWASWCGPCRRENPNVVNVYNKYHDKGLEIIGVSLDKPGQKDKWLKAIEVDKLTWHHVSSLQYFNDPVAQLYQIRSIPATYILDSNGTIVAKNLRGPALEAKIAELLD